MKVEDRSQSLCQSSMMLRNICCPVVHLIMRSDHRNLGAKLLVKCRFVCNNLSDLFGCDQLSDDDSYVSDVSDSTSVEFCRNDNTYKMKEILGETCKTHFYLHDSCLCELGMQQGFFVYKMS